jgi:undecaprenyl-diphosphatase
VLKDYVILIINVVLLYFRDRRKVINAVLGFLSTGVLITIMKYLIGRMRPFEVVENSKSLVFDYRFESFNTSFPSWHTGAMFSLLPFAFYVDKRLGYIMLIIGVIVGLSRIYSGFHYLSDVLFGGLFGYLIGYLFLKKVKI